MQYVLMDMAMRIRTSIAELGLDIWGVAAPYLSEDAQRHMRAWLAAGRHAGMRWMARSERLARWLAPANLMPRMGSMLVVALRHAPPPYGLEEALHARDRGQIAAYAQGRDYHEVLKRRLKALAQALAREGILGDARVYVDTAPVAETWFAGQAGIGWKGKHSLVISRRHGSWMLLGEIALDCELPPSRPATSHCGSCRRCMDACPTGAILAPGIVDARRCLSYWTIEHKGFVPRWIRMRLGNRVFGCDDCQLVCPWNRKADTVSRNNCMLAPRKELVLPPLTELLALDDAAFRTRFRGSPIRRTGRARFVRNAVLAAGNSEDSRLFEPIKHRLRDSSPLVRAHAAWALARLAAMLGSRWQTRAARALEEARHREADPRVCREIQACLEGRLDGAAPRTHSCGSAKREAA